MTLDAHSMADYLIGVALVLSPSLFGFDQKGTPAGIFVFGGCALIIYSLLTRYEYSVARVLPLGTHMVLDVIVALTLMLSPTVLGYAQYLTGFQYALHFVFGIGLLGIVAITQPRASARVLDFKKKEEEQQRKPPTRRAA